MDFNVFKDILLKNKEEILQKIKEAEKANLYEEGAAADELDVASNLSNASLMKRLVERQSFYLKRINIALKKIDDGTYGECEECGEMISDKRLLARPVAVRCILCKEKQERQERIEKLPRGFTSDD